MRPKVSILIPSYNQGRYIRRTLNSIVRQDYPGEVEIIVSDGGSRDSTCDVLKSYGDRVRWWSEPDKGYADAVNRALAAATGDIVGIQSSDDYYLPDAFSRLVAELERDPAAVFATGGRVRVGPNLAYLGFQAPSQKLLDQAACFSMPPCQESTFVRRSALKAVGGVTRALDFIADHILWLEVTGFGYGRCIRDFVAAYTVHPDQRTARLTARFSTDWLKAWQYLIQSPHIGASFKHGRYLQYRCALRSIDWSRRGQDRDGIERAIGELRAAHSLTDRDCEYLTTAGRYGRVVEWAVIARSPLTAFRRSREARHAAAILREFIG